MKTWQSILFGIFVGVILVTGMQLLFTQPKGTPIVLLPSPTPAPIQVHVTGAVNQPGLYSLPKESRLKEAIDAAGGFHAAAATNSVNLAAHLKDGERIVVSFLPTPGPVLQTPGAEVVKPGLNDFPVFQEGTPAPDKLNINNATLEALEKLPGIGPTRAEQILAYRTAHGDFKKIEDLQKVSGIGPSIFEKLKPLITVQP